MLIGLVFFSIGCVLGLLIGWLTWRRSPDHFLAEKTALTSQIHAQFETLANRIFDEKSRTFRQDSAESLGHLLNPLRERLQDFQQRVDLALSTQAKEQYSLKNEIEKIVAAHQNLSQQAQNLTRALTGDSKTQGHWGEVMLEKILQDSGLRKGLDYLTQGEGLNLKHVEEGGSLRPDVIVLLPEEKHIIIDSKVSLSAYERFCTADSADAQAQHIKDHLTSIKNHIQGLRQRRYQDTARLGAPDFVLMFLPVEGAYALAVQHDSNLHSFAWDQKIILVCPATLFATLRTVASVWRIELQNRNAQEIARQGGNLYDKFVGFVEDMQNLGKKIAATHSTYEDALKKLTTGHGNLVRRAEEMKALGLKTARKMPVQLLPDEDTDQEKNQSSQSSAA